MYLFDKVLVPTDFGPAAWNAIKIAIDICRDGSSSITLLHIFPSSARFDKKTRRVKIEDNQEMERIKQKMKALCDELTKGKNLIIDSVILKGWVEEEILDFIKKNKFDLVVMGVNSNGLDNRPGSHITKMIERTSTPLMIIPNTLVKEAVNS
ncbi:MAG: universal stress protein [Bacteroidota bacterium]